jgi:hypothetical protein
MRLLAAACCIATGIAFTVAFMLTVAGVIR